MRYKLLSDDDGHYFLVPVESEDAFNAFLESVYDGDSEIELPIPEDVISMGCSPNRLTFTDPKF